MHAPKEYAGARTDLYITATFHAILVRASNNKRNEQKPYDINSNDTSVLWYMKPSTTKLTWLKTISSS